MDVDRIKVLWLENYGRKNRLATDGPSAFQIAAMRWKRKQLDISADDVHSLEAASRAVALAQKKTDPPQLKNRLGAVVLSDADLKG